MNTTQLKHALARAAAIYNKRYQELTEKFTTPAVKITSDEAAAALSAREFTMYGREFGRYDHKKAPEGVRWYWVDVVDRFISFHDESAEKVDPALFPAQAKLTAAHEKLKDYLHLGETSEAIKLLEAFTNGQDPE